MQAVADQLKEDTARPESLLDLSLVVEGSKVRPSVFTQARRRRRERSHLHAQPIPVNICVALGRAVSFQSCVLFKLLRFFFFNSWPRENDFDGEKADKTAARQLIVETVLPLMPKLLRSFDLATVDAATGNNALHELCSYFTISPRSDYDYTLAEQFIARGVDVHARDSKGRTVLLKSASVLSFSNVSTDGLRLLLAHGADPNAQDGDGSSVLHHLVRNRSATVLEAWMSGDGSGLLDLHLVNSTGQTAFDLAATQPDWGGMSGADGPQKRTHRLMAAQKYEWVKHVRPVLLCCLKAALPVTDVAKLALGYIDGNGLPFAAAVEAESDEEAESAVAAAAQS